MQRVVTCAMAMLGCSLLAAATETNLKVVDVFAAYDLSAAEELAAAGRSPDAFWQEQIDRMNLCLVNSGLSEDFTFRLAGSACFDVDTRRSALPEILSELGDAKTATGVWKQVWAARDACGADLFTFATGGDIKYSQRGFGWTLAGSSGTYGLDARTGRSQLTTRWQEHVADNYCFSVVSLQAIAAENDYTLAHEVAHNMGCGHPDDHADWQGTYDFSYARRFADGLVTVMGYGNGAMLRVAPVFSSPDVTFEGLTTGDVTHDNVRTLRNNYRFVAGYRVSQQAAEGPGDTPAVDPADPDRDFAPSGAFAPAKAVAVKADSPYQGGVFGADGSIQGVIQLKIGKMNVKKAISKVGGTVVFGDGRKFTVKAANVPTGETPQAADLTVTKLGTLSLTFGANGFSGRLTTTDGRVMPVRTADVMGGLKARPATFRMAPPENLGGFPVIASCLPDGTEVRTVNGKWVTDKASVVKYVKVKDPVTAAAAFELLVDTGHGKTNRSGLKLAYAAKTGTFKGSFTFYVDAGTAAKPKIKKVKATVMGVVVDGVARGTATVRNAGSWPVAVE